MRERVLRVALLSVSVVICVAQYRHNIRRVCVVLRAPQGFKRVACSAHPGCDFSTVAAPSYRVRRCTYIA